MTTPLSKEVLLADLDRAVAATLNYFDGPGRVTTARVDRWQARDILMHFLYFHDATTWGDTVRRARRRAVAGPGRCGLRERGVSATP